MLEKLHKFKKVLLVEFEDLEEDIEMLIKAAIDKSAQGNITNYVFKENISLLKQEIFGMEKIIEVVKKHDVESCGTVECLRDEVFNDVKKTVTTSDMPDVVIRLAERKINKVYIYVMEGHLKES